MKSSKNILIMLSKPFIFTKEQLEQVKRQAIEYSLTVIDSGDVTEEHIAEAEVVFGWPNIDLLKKAVHLKWLHLPSAGADRYCDLSKYADKSVILTNSSGTFGKPMAEHAISLIFAFYRNLHLHIRNTAESKWIKHDGTRDFFNSTVGIIGLGDIGTEVALRSKALGAKVIAVKRNVIDKPDYIDELYGEEDIDILLEKSDSIVLALPNTDKTQGMLSAERIKKMKSSAFIVNLGRGTAIDQDALIKALQEKRIAGVGLDVTTPEPLPKDSPLWTMENVIITAHTSGLSPTSKDRNIDIFTDNLIHYIVGEKMRNTVDFNEGY